MRKKIAPKISIIIPVYNAEKYLQQCLDSVVNQTLKEIEVLCVNDGSKDGSLNILEEYQKKDSRIKVFTQENSGPATARNVGLENAKGEYVWFVDADDWIELNACEILYVRAKIDNLDILIFCAYNVPNIQPTKADISYRALDCIPAYFEQKVFTLEEGKSFLFNIPREMFNKLLKKDFLYENNLYFEEKFYEDIIFNMKCIYSSHRFGVLKKFLYNYNFYANPNSIISTASDKIHMVVDNYYKQMEQYVLEKDVNRNSFYYWAGREFSTMNYWINRKNVTMESSKIYYLKLQNFYRTLNRQIYSEKILKSFYSYKQINIIKNTSFEDYIAGKNVIFDNKIFKIIHIGNLTKKYKLFDITIYKKIKTQNLRKIYFLSIEFFKEEKTQNKEVIKIFGIPILKKKISKESTKRYLFGVCYQNRHLNASINEEVKKIQNQIFNLKKDIEWQMIISNLHQKTFPRFKNINSGKDVIVVGAGPTLKHYEQIGQAIHIGVNRTFLNDAIKLDYLFLLDYDNVKRYIKQANTYREKECQKFYGMFARDNHLMHIPDSEAHEANALRYYTGDSNFNINEDYKYGLESRIMPCFWSCIFQAAHFALYTNPAKLYIVGCDCNFNGYFDGEKQIIQDTEMIDKHQILIHDGWKKFKKYAKLHYPETEIISINPVGLKGMFDKDIFTDNFLKEIGVWL
jgi:glycosyltransferase involved in cell wall biosynthesis